MPLDMATANDLSKREQELLDKTLGIIGPRRNNTQDDVATRSKHSDCMNRAKLQGLINSWEGMDDAKEKKENFVKRFPRSIFAFDYEGGKNKRFEMTGGEGCVSVSDWDKCTCMILCKQCNESISATDVEKHWTNGYGNHVFLGLHAGKCDRKKGRRGETHNQITLNCGCTIEKTMQKFVNVHTKENLSLHVTD
eukprot:scaffold101589_cov36-Cyclotella_meneghiniana.AAC.2